MKNPTKEEFKEFLNKEEFKELCIIDVDALYNRIYGGVTEPFDWKSITSVEKAFERVGKDYQQFLHDNRNVSKHFLAAMEIEVVFEAINDGWVADWFNHNQAKYYPWFETKSNDSVAGFSFFGTDYDCFYSDAGLGVRFCTDNSTKAEFIGRNFGKQYNTMMLG